MQKIKDLITKIVLELKYPSVDFVVEHPREEKMGDYSVNVAMVLTKQVGKNPREIASQIVEKIIKDPTFIDAFEKVEVAGAGFINFYLKQEFFLEEVKKVKRHLLSLPIPIHSKNSTLDIS